MQDPAVDDILAAPCISKIDTEYKVIPNQTQLLALSVRFRILQILAVERASCATKSSKCIENVFFTMGDFFFYESCLVDIK